MDRRVIDEALRSLNKNHGSLLILYVIKVSRILPIDAEPELEHELQRAEEVLGRCEKIVGKTHTCDTEIIQAREPGYAVVQEAIKRRVDMVVLGEPYHKTFGKFRLNEDIAYVLEHAPCEITLLRGSPKRSENDSAAPLAAFKAHKATTK